MVLFLTFYKLSQTYPNWEDQFKCFKQPFQVYLSRHINQQNHMYDVNMQLPNIIQKWQSMQIYKNK